ncbi:type II toxin-antitoxin system RelE/ParE family toxin [Candidatus Bipolaricaulota bacterium]|nr:type II toxin-antitoxin system RelE/ParE family toxin [Candidatus Bipolaricaulota bacterium]
MASYRVLVKPSAVRELEAVPRKGRKLLAERIQGLGATPRPPGCEKLSGGDRYRVRQGDYRIIYSVDDDQQVVRVIKVGHRREMYR